MQKKNVGGGAPRLKPAVAGGPVPVTLLSGFLGSGKTTLLQHILRNKEGLRCALVVNDMAEINIDASLVKGTRLLQTKEKMVELHNGCICCTLREDLLLALREMALSNAFDVIVIESTGVSEPMQVAETFFMDQEDGNGILNNIARLDNCVTVVDVSTFEDSLRTLDTVSEKYGGGQAVPCVAPTVAAMRSGPTDTSAGRADDDDNAEDGPQEAQEDDRNISHLLVDQVEFANVILLNKVDLVSQEQVNTTLALLHKLNPAAKVVCTTKSTIDVRDVLFTERFTHTFAQQAKGWMADITTGIKHTPETLEYGIGSFVYRSDRAFHPGRLGTFLTRYFMLQEIEAPPAEGQGAVDAPPIVGENSSEESRMASRQRAAARLQDLGGLFRSKGYVWIGSPSRLGSFGEWSQAGNILSLTCGGGWGMFPDLPATPSTSGQAASTSEHTVPLAQRAAEFAAKAAVAAKRAEELAKQSKGGQGAVEEPSTTMYFAEKTPCQELVIIGQDLRRDVIRAMLDECLLRPDEEAALTSAMMSHPVEVLQDMLMFEDPFEPWALDDDEDEWEEEAP